MKRTILLAACFAGVLAMSAQDVWSSAAPAQRVEFGPRVGLNVSSMTNLSMNSRAGVNAGIAVNVGIVESMYINSGVFFTMKGAKGTFEGETPTGDSYKYKRSYSPMYIQIPLQASYRYNFNPDVQWQLNFGPYFGIGVGGKYKFSGDGLPSTEADMFGNDTGQLDCHRFDFGLGIGTGVNFRNFVFSINYNFGLTNVYSFDGVKITDGESPFEIEKVNKGVKNGVFSINVGYNF